MWEISRRAHKLAIVTIALFGASINVPHAQETFINQSNITGFSLPGVQLPNGQDEVRAADGTTCRSAVSGSGAYLDVGVIGNPTSLSGRNSNSSAYGRFVVPLGKKPVRLDCTRLYNVEVRRLELELKLMELGLTRGIAPVSELSAPEEGKDSQNTKVANASSGDAWDEDGWSLEGRQQ